MDDIGQDDDLPETATCPECQETKLYGVFGWTHDRYGIPWKKVCDDCYESVLEKIGRFQFDEGDAGECLDEDY